MKTSVVFLVLVLAGSFPAVSNQATKATKPPAPSRYSAAQQFLITLLLGSHKPSGLSGSTFFQENGLQMSLDEVLTGALQLVVTEMIMDNPNGEVPDFSKEMEVLQTLKDEGSDKVYMWQILTLPSVQKLIGGGGSYLTGNLRYYLYNDFMTDISPVCKNQSMVFFDSLGAGKMWALKMFDAAAKPPRSLFLGNINWVGNWDQCHQVKSNGSRPEFRGKYCRASIGIPKGVLPIENLPGLENAKLEVGICFPDQCTEKDVAAHVRAGLDLVTLTFLPVVEVECEGEEHPDSDFWIVIGVVIGMAVLIAAATIYDGVRRFMMQSGEVDFQDATAQRDTSDEIASSSNDIPLKKLSLGGQENQGFHNDETPTANQNGGPASQQNGRPASQQNGTPRNQAARSAAAPRSADKQQAVPEPQTTAGKLVVGCSAIANTEFVFDTYLPDTAITALDGIRVISTTWVILGHVFNYATDRSRFVLLENGIDVWDLQKEFNSQTIINGTFAVDTFFFMSALLMTFLTMKKWKRSGKIYGPKEWFFFYFLRWLRIVPALLFVVAVYTWVLPWVGNGPLWSTRQFPPNRSDCVNYFWAYALLIHNFIPNGIGSKCLGYTWYVANDYQLWAISPIIMIIMFFSPIASFILMFGIVVASLIAGGYIYQDLYVYGDSITTLLRVWDDYYVKPYTRCIPWMIGIAFGYLFFKTQGRIRMKAVYVILGWMLATAGALSCVWGSFANFGEGMTKIDTLPHTLYNVLTRILWALCIGWVVFACHKGYGGIVNRLLSWSAYRPLSKMTYVAYLIHPAIMLVYMFLQKSLIFATEITLVYLYFGHLITTFVIAYIIGLLVEFPMANMQKILFKQG